MSKMMILTPEEASEYMGGLLAPNTIRRKASRSEIPFVCVGRFRVFVPKELEMWCQLGSTPDVARDIMGKRRKDLKQSLK